MSRFDAGEEKRQNLAGGLNAPPDRLANAVFIAQMTGQLHRLATTKKLVKLARILDMIHFEAVMQSYNLKKRIDSLEV
ncbi:MAG TPA: hypothetical protein VME69_11475 [Methylocella sp.]|nr:hypothetical protein [Methylocella sp.]